MTLDTALDAIPDIIDAVAIVVTVASLFCMGTRTPDPGTRLGRVYRVVELLALNFGRAKEQGDKKNDN